MKAETLSDGLRIPLGTDPGLVLPEGWPSTLVSQVSGWQSRGHPAPGIATRDGEPTGCKPSAGYGYWNVARGGRGDVKTKLPGAARAGDLTPGCKCSVVGLLVKAPWVNTRLIADKGTLPGF